MARGVQPEELRDRVLAGTTLLERTRESLVESEEHVSGIFTKHVFEPYADLFPPETVSLARYRWVLGMVWSRGFALKAPTGARAEVRGVDRRVADGQRSVALTAARPHVAGNRAVDCVRRRLPRGVLSQPRQPRDGGQRQRQLERRSRHL